MTHGTRTADTQRADDEVETAAALVCLELAFLVPRGTNVNEHSMAKAILRLVKAARAAERAASDAT